MKNRLLIHSIEKDEEEEKIKGVPKLILKTPEKKPLEKTIRIKPLLISPSDEEIYKRVMSTTTIAGPVDVVSAMMPTAPTDVYLIRELNAIATSSDGSVLMNWSSGPLEYTIPANDGFYLPEQVRILSTSVFDDTLTNIADSFIAIEVKRENRNVNVTPTLSGWNTNPTELNDSTDMDMTSKTLNGDIDTISPASITWDMGNNYDGTLSVRLRLNTTVSGNAVIYTSINGSDWIQKEQIDHAGSTDATYEKRYTGCTNVRYIKITGAALSNGNMVALDIFEAMYWQDA